MTNDQAHPVPGARLDVTMRWYRRQPWSWEVSRIALEVIGADLERQKVVAYDAAARLHALVDRGSR